MIELKAVNKAFGENILFQDLTFSVPTGSVTCLLGPSGCGKTSLLNLMAGLLIPDSGTVSVPGRLSYVFQESRLLPWQTLEENAVYAMDPQTSKTYRHDRAGQFLRQLELDDATHLLPDEISGGMARRTALARALLAPHDALFLDEPLSSLDPDMRGRIVGHLPERLAGKTVVLVTHDYITAAALSDRIFRMTLPPVSFEPVRKQDLEGTLDQIERLEKERVGGTIPD